MKQLTVLFLLFTLLFCGAFQLQNKLPPSATLSDEVFAILEEKCNVCHRKRKKRYVFTRENATDFAAEIEQAVFIKKRMPKGRKNKLTDAERTALRAWLDGI